MKRPISIAVGMAVAALTAAGCASTASGHVAAKSTSLAAAAPLAAAASSAPAPAPTPSPHGRWTGSCDVSLSDSLSGPNYLTADISVHNTGNIGMMISATAKWGQQGFGPVTQTKTVRLPAGQSRTVHLHYTATEEQVSRFQDVQLANSNGDGCHYRVHRTTTFGQPR